MEYLKFIIEHANSPVVLWAIIIILIFANILLFALYKTKSVTLRLAETTINIVFARWHFVQSEDELLKETLMENQLLKEQLKELESKNNAAFGTIIIIAALFFIAEALRRYSANRAKRRLLDEQKEKANDVGWGKESTDKIW